MANYKKQSGLVLADKLRKAVLQSAIQGQLVTQVADDGQASDLLDEILAEKQRLIDEKVIKKEKPLSPITDDEKPFDIPDNWVWVRLGDIGQTNIGLTYDKKDISDEGTIVLRSGNIQDGKIDLNDLVKIEGKIPKSKICQINDLLICARNGSKKLVGKTAIIDKDGYSFGAFMAIFRTRFFRYVYYYLTSPYFRSDFDGVSTTTINQITQDNLKNRLIPLPPLAEQERIVKKLDEILPQLDDLAKSETALNALQSAFPKQMQSALLQSAISGQLTEQLASDGKASDLLTAIQAEKQRLIDEKVIKRDKPLAEITDDEKPFDIPDNWVWVRLGDLSTYIQRGKSPKYSLIEKVPVISQKCVQWSGFDIKPAKFIEPDTLESYDAERILQDDDLLWNSTGLGTVGRITRYSSENHNYEKAVVDSHVTIVRLVKNKVIPKYIESFISSAVIQSNIEDICNGSTKQKELATSTVKETLIPLPPLAEQERIVAKLDELLPQIQQLA